MSEDQFFPPDYYLSFPHLRLSRKRFIILENDSLYHVKIKGDQSHVKYIDHLSEIQKMEVVMVRSKYNSHLFAFFLPRVGRKKSYPVSALKGFYKDSDWQRVINFFRETGFKPHIYANRELASKITRPISMDDRVWFPPHDQVFQLYQDPVFFEQLTSITIKAFPIILAIIGFSALIPSIIFAIVAFDDFLLVSISLLGVSTILLALGLPKLIRYVKKKKDLVNKYNIGYYFK